ncbi:MAG: hypothetical protein JKY37_28825 [Nannocystaceae bacterium]|nr:hypothetical protein [Nannocystaceae bacterium]
MTRSDGQGCYPIDDMLTCAPDVSGADGGPGDPCAFINICQDGLWCAGSGAVPGCLDNACCSPFCRVGDDDACLTGQICVAYYAEDEAPLTCLEEVGVCTIEP